MHSINILNELIGGWLGALHKLWYPKLDGRNCSLTFPGAN